MKLALGRNLPRIFEVAPRACAGRGLKRRGRLCHFPIQRVAPRACAGRGLKR